MHKRFFFFSLYMSMAFLHSGTSHSTRVINAEQWSPKGTCCLSSCQKKMRNASGRSPSIHFFHLLSSLNVCY